MDVIVDRCAGLDVHKRRWWRVCEHRARVAGNGTRRCARSTRSSVSWSSYVTG